MLPLPHGPLRHPGVLAVGETVALNRVLMRALWFRKVNVKEAFTLADARGRFFRASLLSSHPRGGEALVYEEMSRSPEPALELTLVCAVLARQRMLFVCRTSTELGVTRIQPVFTERSVGPEGLEHEKAHAWDGQARRAALQCRRSSVPLTLPTVPLREALEADWFRSAPLRLVMDDRWPAGSAPPPRRDGAAPGPSEDGPVGPACLLAGPEGGWTDPERALLAQSRCLPLDLGPRVLRAETAVIAGLTLVQHRLGDVPGLRPPPPDP